MNRAGHFEKVTWAQFLKDMNDAFPNRWTEEEIKDFYNNIQKPTRATKGSNGYDFRSPIPFDLNAWEDIKFPTGIRAIIDDGWWLFCAPRSGSGFKQYLRLANTIGDIDSDFWMSKNEGDIWAKIRVEKDDGFFSVQPGDAFMQATFLPYGITYDDASDGVRDGGLGSTGT